MAGLTLAVASKLDRGGVAYLVGRAKREVLIEVDQKSRVEWLSLKVQGVDAPWTLDPYVRIRVRTKTNGVFYNWHLTVCVPDV